MALRQIRTEEDPILRKISKPVKEMTPRTLELIDDMCESLESFNGVGLAAVQVGVLKRICIINIDPEDLVSDPDSEEAPQASEGYEIHTGGEDMVVINPVVEEDGCETQTGNEGCLSFPGKWGVVTRPLKVTLKAFDREMKPFELKAEGLLARAICHETDHMDGHLYVDKVEGPVHTSDENEEDGED